MAPKIDAGPHGPQPPTKEAATQATKPTMEPINRLKFFLGFDIIFSSPNVRDPPRGPKGRVGCSGWLGCFALYN